MSLETSRHAVPVFSWTLTRLGQVKFDKSPVKYRYVMRCLDVGAANQEGQSSVSEYINEMPLDGKITEASSC
jgi:hypothetical protein